jgi:hypothetical protein
VLEQEAILFFSFGYIGLLFGIAYIADKHAQVGGSIISNPYIYARSLAVYCTTWTFTAVWDAPPAAEPGF